MSETCFVIMPFGGRFDNLYENVFVPTINELGLTPLRADEIYDNRSINYDINNLIRNSAVIIADVSGQNPNVNYELGIAHGLEKEVVIVTADSNDVPSDYRHIRYLYYNIEQPNWGDNLSAKLRKTISNVLSRNNTHDESYEYYEDDYELDNVIETARELEYNFQLDTHNPSHALLKVQDSIVMLDCRNGVVSEWDAAAASLIANKIEKFSKQLPKGHILRMRSMFFDIYGSQSFKVDYLYDRSVIPMYTSKELSDIFDDEFDGILFMANIRYIQENFDHDRFFANDSIYYHTNANLTFSYNAVCSRNGFYVSEISDVYVNESAKHCFYKLSGLIPKRELESRTYQKGESHWLADWNQVAPRVKERDIVRFKIKKIYPVENRSHISNARNINFSQFEIINSSEE